MVICSLDHGLNFFIGLTLWMNILTQTVDFILYSTHIYLHFISLTSTTRGFGKIFFWELCQWYLLSLLFLQSVSPFHARLIRQWWFYFKLEPQLPQKMKLPLKVVKSDSKNRHANSDLNAWNSQTVTAKCSTISFFP